MKSSCYLFGIRVLISSTTDKSPIRKPDTKMSWVARSLASSLRLDEDDADADDDEECDIAPNQPDDFPSTSPKDHESPHPPHQHQRQQQQQKPQFNELGSEKEALRGVQEDLNVFKQTLTRQFWGMASFLAPPPTDSNCSFPSDAQTQSDPPASTCNRSDPSDQCVSGNGEESEGQRIGGDSSDIDYASFGREASENSGTNPNMIPFGSESVGYEESEMEEDIFERAVGITDEVLAFARNISMHPETWLDFPIDEEEDTSDFEMSDAQQDHAFAIEGLAPRLAALRIELCPCHMSESYFWKVYFVLLHSRLNKEDAGVLSTPQVMEARAMWMEELQKQVKLDSECYGRSTSYSRDTAHEDFSPRFFDNDYSGDMPYGTYEFESTTLSMKADHETQEHLVESSETHILDKSVIEESPRIKTEDKDLIGRSSKLILQDFEDDDDEWPEESCAGTPIPMPLVNEEDISFSDLEDENYSVIPVKSNTDSKAL